MTASEAQAVRSGDVIRPLRVTALLGRSVLAGEDCLGRLSDLVIDDVGEAPEVVALLVTTPEGTRTLSAEVVSVSPDGSLVATSNRDSPRLVRHPIRLRRDVLDAQIVDLRGHRVVRVGDVELARYPNDGLAVVGVAVGFDAVLRRLHLGCLAGHLPGRLVPWPSLHLTSRSGHAVQIASRAEHLRQISSDDLAHLISQLSTDHATDVLHTTDPTTAAAALSASHDDVAARLLTGLGDHAEPLLQQMPPGRAAHLRRLSLRQGRRPRFHRTKGWLRHRPPPIVGAEP